MSNETDMIIKQKCGLLKDLLEQNENLNIEFHGGVVYVHECFDYKVLRYMADKYKAHFDGNKIVIYIKDVGVKNEN